MVATNIELGLVEQIRRAVVGMGDSTLAEFLKLPLRLFAAVRGGPPERRANSSYDTQATAHWDTRSVIAATSPSGSATVAVTAGWRIGPKGSMPGTGLRKEMHTPR